MHIHHLHVLIQHARLLAGAMRVLGAMLFMLLFGLPGLDGAGTARDPLETRENRLVTVGASSVVAAAGKRAAADAAMAPLSRGAEGARQAVPGALPADAHPGVFSRLEPGIVMLPRMNRTPKPKSVYRVLARAPGEAHLLSYPDARTASSGGSSI